MRSIARLLLTGILPVVLLFAGCGGSDSGDSEAVSESGGTDKSVDGAPLADQLATRNFKTVAYQRFPAQATGMKAHVLTYNGNKDGGVIFLQGYAKSDPGVVWHWYFEGAKPDSAGVVELNEDGLWDMRIYMHGGKTNEYIQDSDFSFSAPGRDDHIAMNGGSSSDNGLWKCFDGDSLTTWQATGGAYVNVSLPLGVSDGILMVQLGKTDRPSKCDVQMNGKSIQKVDLDATLARQLIQLNESAKGASEIRLVFESAGSSNIAVAEVGIR